MKICFCSAGANERKIFLRDDIYSREILKNVGFSIIDRGNSYYAVLPEGWKIFYSNKTTVKMFDQDNNARGDYIFDNESDESPTRFRLYNRYEVWNEIITECNKNLNTVYLIDRKSRRRIKLCYCNPTLVDVQFHSMCIQSVKEQLSTLYPGWDNIEKWEENPFKFEQYEILAEDVEEFYM